MADELIEDRQTTEATAPDQGDVAGAHDSPELLFDQLQQILLARDRARIDDLEAQLGDLDARLANADALAALIAPGISQAIRRQVREDQQGLIEALYPLVGQLVVHSVSVAIRDLARTVDARTRSLLTPRLLWRRMRAQFSGVSGAEFALRDALSFQVLDIFLIHRETGLLLQHFSRLPQASPDSDLISGMLTAIRDFVQDAFGRGMEGELDEIQYGQQRILIETAQYAYLAAVVDGIEPAGFRFEMRKRVIDVDQALQPVLRQYQGDASLTWPAAESLQELLSSIEEPPVPASSGLTPVQKRILLAVLIICLLCLITACGGGWWLWRTARALAVTPTPVVIMVVATPTPGVTPTDTVTPTPTPSASPSPSPTPSASPSPSPTATATSSPSAPATAAPGALIRLRHANIWAEPDIGAPIVATATAGQQFDLLARSPSGIWSHICCPVDGGPGWVPSLFLSVQETD